MSLPVALALLAALAQSGETVRPKLVLVATHPALGSIAAQVGGDRVEVTSITRPTADIHTVEAKPSVFALLSQADVFVHTGLDLELWAEPVVKGSRNPKIQPGAPGNLDASQGIKLLQIPENPSRADGDVHIYGNPHYWMDPLNALTISTNIAAGLTAVDPGSAEFYLKNSNAFQADLKSRLKTWLRQAIPKKHSTLVVYHDSFPYFIRRFGFELAGTIEPKPRIPPTQKHLLALIDTIESRHVAILVREPFHDQDATGFLAQQTGATVVTLGTMPGFTTGTETYQDLIEYDLAAFLGALP